MDKIYCERVCKCLKYESSPPRVHSMIKLHQHLLQQTLRLPSAWFFSNIFLFYTAPLSILFFSFGLFTHSFDTPPCYIHIPMFVPITRTTAHRIPHRRCTGGLIKVFIYLKHDSVIPLTNGMPWLVDRKRQSSTGRAIKTYTTRFYQIYFFFNFHWKWMDTYWKNLLRVECQRLTIYDDEKSLRDWREKAGIKFVNRSWGLSLRGEKIGISDSNFLATTSSRNAGHVRESTQRRVGRCDAAGASWVNHKAHESVQIAGSEARERLRLYIGGERNRCERVPPYILPPLSIIPSTHSWHLTPAIVRVVRHSLFRYLHC